VAGSWNGLSTVEEARKPFEARDYSGAKAAAKIATAFSQVRSSAAAAYAFPGRHRRSWTKPRITVAAPPRSNIPTQTG
jgi:hypothetical protein